MRQTEVEKAWTLVPGDGKDVGKTEDPFEENFKELKKWVDVKSSKFVTLTVLREKRCGRLGTALKVLSLAHLFFWLVYVYFILVSP